MTNSALLRGRIDDSGLKLKYIAHKMGLSPYGLTKKIDNLNEFKASEILLICDILGIEAVEDKELIFFNRM